MSVPLKVGTVLTADERKIQFRIKKTFPHGASTNTYVAEKTDRLGVKHTVILKELCPGGMVANKRNGTAVIWNSGSMEAEKAKYIELYKKICALKINETNENRFCFCGVYDLFDENDIPNNTVYYEVPFESNTTYDTVCGETLSEILETGKQLCSITEALHNKGWLHLDIKPSNILRIDNSNGQSVLKFLDFDTVQEKSAFMNGTGILYQSPGYAAPELLNDYVHPALITESTDIFAIGVIIFERIMGRTPQSEDMQVFSDFDFDRDDPLFSGVNKCFFDELRTFFRSILSAYPFTRYQSCKDAMDELDKLIFYVKNPPGVYPEKGYENAAKDFSESEDEDVLFLRNGYEFLNCMYPDVEVDTGNGSECFSSLGEAINSIDIPKGKDRNRFVLFGEHLGGKTAQLQRYAYELLKLRGNSVPLYVSVKDIYHGEGLGIMNYLWTAYFAQPNILLQSESEMLAAFNKRSRAEPEYTLLIDDCFAVDWGVEKHYRQDLFSELEKLNKCRNIRIVVSTSDGDELRRTSLLARYQIIKIKELSDEQIDRCCKLYGKYVPSADDNFIVRRLISSVGYMRFYIESADAWETGCTGAEDTPASLAVKLFSYMRRHQNRENTYSECDREFCQSVYDYEPKCVFDHALAENIFDDDGNLYSNYKMYLQLMVQDTSLNVVVHHQLAYLDASCLKNYLVSTDMSNDTEATSAYWELEEKMNSLFAVGNTFYSLAPEKNPYNGSSCAAMQKIVESYTDSRRIVHRDERVDVAYVEDEDGALLPLDSQEIKKRSQQYYLADDSGERCYCQMCRRIMPMDESQIISIEKNPKIYARYMYLCLCPNCAKKYEKIRENEQNVRRLMRKVECGNFHAGKANLNFLVDDKVLTFSQSQLEDIGYFLMARNGNTDIRDLHNKDIKRKISGTGRRKK